MQQGQQEDQIQLFRAPDIDENENIQSFLITLIDGTGSMAEEYESIVKAHQGVFGYLGNDQLRYQWDEQINGQEKLHNFLPFRDARGGNISLTFKCLFNHILAGNYPKNITIAFISDGVEPYEYNEIANQVIKMKERHFIQFISVAVGDLFPNSISNDLRDHIHNQNKTCPPIFYAKREFVWTEDGMGRPKNEIEQELRSIFLKIKDLLKVSKNHLVVSQPVYQILTQKEPSQEIAPKEPFFTQGKIEIKINDQIIASQNEPSFTGSIDKPDAICDFIDQKAIQPEVIKVAPEQQVKQVQTKFDKLKIGCFVRCKGTKKQLDLVESIEFTVFDSITNMRQVYLGTQQLNWIQELKSVIHNSLKTIYDSQKTFTLTEGQLRTFGKINELLKLLDEFDKVEPKTKEKTMAFFDACVQLQKMKQIPLNDCQHLPAILARILNLQNDQVQRKMTFLVEKQKSNQSDQTFSVRNFFVADSNNRSCRKFECSTFRQVITKMTNMMRSFTYSFMF